MSISLLRYKSFYVASLIFLALSLGFALANFSSLSGSDSFREYFAGIYGFMALFGGIVGLAASKKWGGLSSHIGRVIVFLSLGLIAQEFGQISYSFYSIFLHVEVPYPSVGDIGFFGSVILYILSALSLFRLFARSGNTGKVRSKLFVVIIPLIILVFSYYEFLRGYEFDFSQPLVVFFDFGYPLLQALYISIALIVLGVSADIMGGVLRSRVLLLIVAFFVQYCADFMFLYKVSRDAYVTSGLTDFLYLLSYFVMTVAIIYFQVAFDVIKNGGSVKAGYKVAETS